MGRGSRIFIRVTIGTVGRRALIAALLATTAMQAGAALTGADAFAQQAGAQIAYDIPAGPLGRALAVFGSQSGTQVSYDAALAAGRTSPGLRGSATREQALARILQGSGLAYSFSDPASVVVYDRVPAAHGGPVDAAGATVLGTIDVTGAAGSAVGWDGSAETVYSTPASVAHISSERIETFRGNAPGDFLSGTPGVLNADNRNSGALDVNIRGMQGFGRVPVVVDGSLQQNTVYRGYAGVANRTYIDPDLISSVAIEKGPGSGVYGVGATGGLAVMQTITADDILRNGRNFGFKVTGGFVGNTGSVPAPWTRGGIQGGTYTTNPAYAAYYPPLPSDWSEWAAQKMDRPAFLEPTAGHGSIAFAARGENYEVVAAYARRKLGNFHAGKKGDGPVVELFESTPPGGVYRVTFPEVNRYRLGEEVLNTSQDNTSYLGKVTLRGGDGHSLELGYRRYESDFGEIMPSVLIDAGPIQAPLSEVRSDAWSARYRWDPEENDLVNLRANLWTTRTHTSITTAYDLFGFLFYESGFKSQENRVGFDISNESVFDTAAGTVALQYGASHTYETIAPSDEPFVSSSSYPMYPLPSRDGWREETSAFATARWKPLDWLMLDGGLRYTRAVAYDNVLSTVPSGPLAGTQLHNRESGSGFAPNATVTIEPLHGWQVYGRYAEALRMASLFESTGAAGQSWSYDPAPLYDLKPERAKTWEFGTNLSLSDVIVDGDRFGLKLAWFNNNVKDFMTRMWFSGVAPEGMPATTMINLPEATFRGIELAANYDSGRFFVEVGGAYYTDIEFCMPDGRCYTGGVPSGYVNQNVPPKFSASATLGMRLLEEKLTLGGRVTHVGERATDYLDLAPGIRNVINWKPYTLVDLFASYKLSEDVTLNATIDNVGDVYYMDSLTLGYNPSPGRTFRASMTAKF